MVLSGGVSAVMGERLATAGRSPANSTGDGLMVYRKGQASAQTSDLRVVDMVPRQASWPQEARTETARQGMAVPRWAVASAGLVPVLLTAGWLVADAVQPSSYSPVRQTVSVMAGDAGADRWVMTGAMLLAGGCYLVTAVGLTTLWLPARILLVVAGLCSIGIATSPEPATGPTVVHLAWTVLGAAAITLLPAISSWRAPPRPALLRWPASIIVFVVFAAMLGWVLAEIWAGDALGLAERTTSSVLTTWPFIIAIAWRRSATENFSAANRRS